MYGIPSYDRLYQIIVEEIENYERLEQKPAVLSWLTTEQDKRVAIAARKAIPPISDIRNPFGSDDIEREQVQYEFFNDFYRDQLNPNGKAEGPELGETCIKDLPLQENLDFPNKEQSRCISVNGECSDQ